MIDLRPRGRSSWIAVAVAIGAVAAVSAVAAGLWSQIGDADISASGWIAMGLGVLVASALGMGLMALVFYSSRRGYDEPDANGR